MNPQAAGDTFEANLSLIASTLRAQNRYLVTAESCTGGLLAARLVEVAGASDWFFGSFVTYREQAKTEMLGIAPELLRDNGLVSEATALAMADRSLDRSSAHYSIAITGLAGPGGDGSGVSVGELWIAWVSGPDEVRSAERFHLECLRQEFRSAACSLAVAGFVERFCAI